MPYVSQSIESKILRSIRARRSALAFSAKDFRRYGSPSSVSQALGRLVAEGHLRRVRHGLYDRPRSHPVLGQTAPDPMAVVKSIMSTTGARWQPSGAYAANLLGLSEQVPAKIVIYTDAPPRRVSLGKLVLNFRRVSSRNLLGAGRPSGLVIQALQYFRKDLSPSLISKLRARLDDVTKDELREFSPLLQFWMRPIIAKITT